MHVLLGRSSSHFTRTVRMLALELGVPHEFRPLFDLSSRDPGDYAGNPALKIPVWVDEQGPLYGSENIWRELVRRVGARDKFVMRGAVGQRALANAEELTVHAMSIEVNVLMARAAGEQPSAKTVASLTNSVHHLDANLDAALAALPAERTLSFFEVSLFCLVEHLPFRDVLDVAPYARLASFVRAFGARESAIQTRYHFDQAPSS